MAQAGTTNLFSVAAANNGKPILSTTQSFLVNVTLPAQPAFSRYTYTNGQFQSWVEGDAGPDYSILGSTNLLDWALIATTNQPAMPFLFVDPDNAGRVNKYYRLRTGP